MADTKIIIAILIPIVVICLGIKKLIPKIKERRAERKVAEQAWLLSFKGYNLRRLAILDTDGATLRLTCDDPKIGAISFWFPVSHISFSKIGNLKLFEKIEFEFHPESICPEAKNTVIDHLTIKNA